MSSVRSADGTAIAYDELGAGPPVILVGGAFSFRKYRRSVELAELLAEHFTVFNYDRRGRGDSGDTVPYSVEREIEDLAALIELAGSSVCVWGQSSAGSSPFGRPPPVSRSTSWRPSSRRSGSMWTATRRRQTLPRDWISWSRRTVETRPSGTS